MLQPQDLKGRRAISYARWSSGKQASGDSLRRQSENAERFCHSYGLNLDREAAVIDDGVSAYKGANLEAGLGQLIVEVETGTISSDVVLLMEDLDRFTRKPPVEVLPTFTSLLRSGLTVVTLSDERVHTFEEYRANSMALAMSLMKMQGSFEYSDKISKRVGESWKGRIAKARDGRIKISKVPFWIDRETQGPNARADDARLIFKLAEDGHGQTSIVRHLNENAIPSSTGGKWEKSMVQATLKSKAAYGSLVLKGEEIRDYFPPLISEDRWLALQHRMRERTRNPQASNTANLFPRLLRCAHCGSTMNLSTTKHKAKTYRYLGCSGRELKRTDCTASSWHYGEFEAEFIDRLGVLAVPQDDPRQADTSSRETELDDAIAALQRQHANLIEAVADATDPETRKAFTAQAEQKSREIETKRRELVQLRESAARYQVSADTMADIADDLEEIQRMAREDRPGAKRLISDLVESITLETDSETLKLAHVTMRHRGTYIIGFDRSGEA